jgi:L-ascorbate metabolism protein UlaG (beta-lactamase superfamily)
MFPPRGRRRGANRKPGGTAVIARPRSRARRVWPLALAALVLVAAALTGFATAPHDDAAGIRIAPYAGTKPPPAAIPALDGAEPTGPAELLLREAERRLALFPPAADPSLERLLALRTLDAVLRQPEAARQPAVQRFFHRRIAKAIAELRQAEVRSGATVWHIYNHGFVVRTASATLCFDLVRARYLPGFALDRLTMGQLADECDVLFVSHVHADHAESLVADALVHRQRPVVAPRQVGYREPLYSAITHLDRAVDVVHRLPIRGGSAALDVVVLPGHQDADIDNNVVLVRTPDGITVAHTGDQWDKDADFAWIDRVGSRFGVDILLPNDWTWDIARLVRGFDPRLVIPGHQNELGHEVAKRQPYLLSYARKAGSGRFGGNPAVGYDQPLVVLIWGESYHYQPAH